MKTLKFFLALTLLSFSYSGAQVSVTVNSGIPAWGVPVTSERYYYIPDIETYYDLSSREYIYLRDGIWVRSATVPAPYRDYDFYHGRKIVINDYNGNAPYAFYNIHRVKYVPAFRPHKIWVKSRPQSPRPNAYSRGHGTARPHRR